MSSAVQPPPPAATRGGTDAAHTPRAPTSAATAQLNPSLSRRSLSARGGDEERVGRKFFVNPLPSDVFVNYDPPVVGPVWIRTNPMFSFIFHPYLVLLRVLHRSKQPAPGVIPFVDNTVRTARYTVLSFIPSQLVVQFSKVANIYFFVVSMLQIVPNVSPTGKFTTIFPLSFFIIVSMIKEGYDDYFRHKQDSAENSSPIQRLVVTSGATSRSHRSSLMGRKLSFKADAEAASGRNTNVVELQSLNSIAFHSTSTGSWENASCKEIRVGDIIRVRDREFIPADIVVLYSSNEDGICFIETSNLDGETNLKQRQALKATFDAIHDVNGLANYHAMMHTESPSGDLYNFDGYLVDAANVRFPLSTNQFLQRGATLRNTKEIYGVAVYTGEESKIRMNSFVPPNSKVSHLGAVTNKVILFILGLLLVFCALGLMAYILWDSRDRAQDGILKHWYLIGDSGYSLVFFTFLILFNAFIPISLYVTMEVVKIVQVYFMVNDLAMYDEERDIPAQANTSALNEDLGQVQYVFSDKTGTLTENVMEFRLFSVAGQAFKHPSVGRRNDAADATVLIQDLSSARAQGYRLNPFRQQCFDFLLAMALCHSAIPDLSQARIDNDMPPFNSEERVPNNHTQNAIVYQSSSADEVAIVNAARDLTFLYKNRTPTSVVLNILNEPTDTEFELLNILEFTSDRKRMSTIYKYPDGRIMLLVKGADNVILERISSAPLNEDQFRIKASILQDVGAFATEGLRTLLYAYRELDSSFYNQWNVRYADALASITNRVANVSAVAEELERELILLGATAIEDKLQEGVPETIETLRKAGIRVWMLTGDKTETAVNIGRTCNLIKKETHVMLLNDETCPLGKGKPLESEVAAISNWVTSTTANFKQLKLQMPNCHILVAVEGRMLTKLEKMAANNQIGGNEETPTFKSLLDLLIAADNVICCRFSPSQKALLVRLVKSRLSKQHHTKGGASELLEELSGGAPSGWSKLWSTLILKPRPSGVTLAIGDGANDIPMLLCAHVGIGITGREGLAASRASDYSIAKFKFLQPLLFVHGRWSYVRICLFTLGTLYKNITFYGTQLVFQFFCGYSGTSLYEQWTLSLNNVLFTSLPVMIVGVFEKDLNRSTLMAVPELYRYGQMNRGFNFRVQLRWLLQGFLHAALSVVLPAILYGGFSWTGGNQTFSTPLFFYANTPTWVKEVFQSDGSGPYQESALYPLGTISYTITVLFCTIKVLYVECHYITGIHHFIGLLTFFVWIAYQFVYSYVWQPHSAFGPDTAYEYSGLYYSLIHSQIRFWGVVILSVVIGLIVEDVSVKFLEMLGRMVRWGAGGGRKSKIVVLETSAEPSKLKDSDPLSQEARIAASHAVGEHDWADEVEWWQRWEQLRMRRYR